MALTIAIITTKIKEQFSLSNEDSGLLVQSAYYILLSLYQIEEETRPIDTLEQRDLYWILMCSQELASKHINTAYGIIKYSENGYSIEYDGATISEGLKALVFPYASGTVD